MWLDLVIRGEVKRILKMALEGCFASLSGLKHLADKWGGVITIRRFNVKSSWGRGFYGVSSTGLKSNLLNEYHKVLWIWSWCRRLGTIRSERGPEKGDHGSPICEPWY